MPNLIDEVKVLGAKRLGPCIADALMVQRDGLGKLVQILGWNIARVMCEPTPTVGEQPEFRGVLLRTLDRDMYMDGFGISPVQK